MIYTDMITPYWHLIKGMGTGTGACTEVWYLRYRYKSIRTGVIPSAICNNWFTPYLLRGDVRGTRENLFVGTDR